MKNKNKKEMFTRERDLAAILQFIIYIRDSCNGIPPSLLCVGVCVCTLLSCLAYNAYCAELCVSNGSE